MRATSKAKQPGPAYEQHQCIGESGEKKIPPPLLESQSQDSNCTHSEPKAESPWDNFILGKNQAEADIVVMALAFSDSSQGDLPFRVDETAVPHTRLLTQLATEACHF